MTQDTDCLRLVGGRDCLERHAPTLCPACFAFAELEGTIFAAEVAAETEAIVGRMRHEHVLGWGLVALADAEAN